MYTDLQDGTTPVGRVLVLEDEMLVAAVVEDCLRDVGATDVFLCLTTRDAEQVLAANQVDCAVLDVRVGASESFGIADRLAEMGIPFVFASAFGSDDLT